MSPHADEFVTLCAGQAAGCLDDREGQRLRDHLGLGCEVCEPALGGYRETVLMLAASAPALKPPASLRTQVLGDGMERAAEQGFTQDLGTRTLEVQTSTALSWKGWSFLWLAAICAVLAVAFWNDSQRLRRELTETRGMLARVSGDLSQVRPWHDILAAPGARVALLRPAGPGAGRAQGRVVFDPASGHAVVICSGLFPPAGATCVLWAIEAGTLRRVAELKPGPGGTASARLEPSGTPAALQGYAVRFERTDGRPGTPVIEGTFAP